jgi:hypothetical protein
MAVCAVLREPVSSPIPVNRVINSVLRASPGLPSARNPETARVRRHLATEIADNKQGKHQGASRERTGSGTETCRSARVPFANRRPVCSRDPDCGSADSLHPGTPSQSEADCWETACVSQAPKSTAPRSPAAWTKSQPLRGWRIRYQKKTIVRSGRLADYLGLWP